MKVELHLQHFLMSSNQLAIIPNFFYGGFECDVYALNNNLYSTEYEIKKTVADFNKDFDKTDGHFDWQTRSTTKWKKHDKIRSGKRTNRFFFVIPASLLGKVIIPDYAGCIIFKDHNGWLEFSRVKGAKRLHNTPTDNQFIRHITGNLNWRYYRSTRE